MNVLTPGKSGTRRAGTGRAAGALGAVALSALLLSGCSDDGDGDEASATSDPSRTSATNQTGDPSDAATLTEDQRERHALVPQAKVGYERALRVAEGKVSGGHMVELELDDTSSGRPVWEADVAAGDGTKHTLKINAVTGAVDDSTVKPDQDSDDKHKRTSRLDRATVTPKQAAHTATDRKKGVVTSIELDSSDEKADAIVWSVDVVTTDDWNKTTYEIDVTDGKVLREHVDRD